MIVIVDHRQDPTDTRYLRLAACLASLNVDCRTERQIYGDLELGNPPAWITDDLRNRVAATIGSATLMLLHCGRDQHLVPEAFGVDALWRIPCLLFTGGDPQQRERQLTGVVDPDRHVVLPAEFAPRLREDWPQSKDGVALRACVERILSGESPKAAARSAFGDPALEAALRELYQMLADGKPSDQILTRRNELLPDDPWSGSC